MAALLPSPQAAGRAVVPVVEALDGGSDPRSQLAGDRRLAVDHSRYRFQAHPGKSRDLAHRGPGPGPRIDRCQRWTSKCRLPRPKRMVTSSTCLRQAHVV